MLKITAPLAAGALLLGVSAVADESCEPGEVANAKSAVCWAESHLSNSPNRDAFELEGATYNNYAGHWQVDYIYVGKPTDSGMRLLIAPESGRLLKSIGISREQ